jgi:hypothetical protein
MEWKTDKKILKKSVYFINLPTAQSLRSPYTKNNIWSDNNAGFKFFCASGFIYNIPEQEIPQLFM